MVPCAMYIAEDYKQIYSANLQSFNFATLTDEK